MVAPLDIAVVAGIHGDEPVGLYVHDWLRERQQDINANIRYVRGNPRAIIRGVRSTEADLNRRFPGNLESAIYEDIRATEIMQEIAGADYVVDFHSTTPKSPPYVICGPGDDSSKLAGASGLDKIVVYSSDGLGYSGTTLGEAASKLGIPNITIEAGSHKRRRTIKTGIRAMENILKYFGAMEGTPTRGDPTYYIVDGPLHETVPNMKIHRSVSEFELVSANQEIARSNGEVLYAPGPFYPALVDRDPERRDKGPEGAEGAILMLMTVKP